MKKKKLIELIIDESADMFGVEAISVVKYPAIEENFVFFNNDFLSLAKVDEEKKQLIGAVLIPDKKINRYDKETNEEYDVYFTKDTIKKAQSLFMSSLRNNNHTLEHQEQVDGLSVVESWIKEDEKFDKSNLWGFKNMPVGTWFVQVSAEGNDDIWDKIKNKEVRGFSIEGWFTDKLIEASKQKDILDEVCEDCPDEITLSKIKDLILENELTPVAELDGEPLFRTKEEANIYAEMFKGCKGSHKHIMDGNLFYMACEDHATSTTKEEYNETGKRKYKRKYKQLEYVSFIKKQALLKYPWDQCMRDMIKEYGNKETAAKVCSAIKNKTVNR
tara:strand:- start:13461 stop:14453 length:993 start_codon:yes stop_codon:yes gene_type:complete